MMNALRGGLQGVSEEETESFSQAPVGRRSFELFGIRPVDPTITLEYPFHESARGALALASLVCFGCVVAAPLGFWLLFRIFMGVVSVSPTGIVATGPWRTVRFRYDDIARIGLLEIPISARGLGSALLKRRAGGDRAVHLVVVTRKGTTRRFMISSYDHYLEILGEISLRTKKPYETIAPSKSGMEWPRPT